MPRWRDALRLGYNSTGRVRISGRVCHGRGIANRLAIASQMNRSETSERRVNVPFTILDGLLVVAAFALSFACVRDVLAIPKPPPPYSGLIIGWVYIATFAGPWLLGPLVQLVQAVRLKRTRWTPNEWAWSAFGVGYAVITWLTGWAFGGCEWMPTPLAVVACRFPYLGPGPIALVCALPRFVHGRGLPWSGWFGLVTAILWSGTGLFFEVAG